ncbi:hypothetical protein [Desulforamulus ferrireducens]|uniref:Lipoprotein n=1 Tax=Desulforamulus ferrireducens TaxID=1833852 RepID=A0A1S6IYM6_9FIRM|nr:hypothetical protein [Desulforamulus ferrireducens]AQS59868.1 hypothetical protein B0537_12700 [Desulforamulus ferrireducens]
MRNTKLILLALLLITATLLQGCNLFKKTTTEQPVTLDKVISKVKIDAAVGHQESSWLRVNGTVKNTSDYPVTAIEAQIILNGDNGVFDTRNLLLAQGKRLEPGQVLSFDSTFEYGKTEIPVITSEAKIITLRFLEKPQPQK